MVVSIVLVSIVLASIVLVLIILSIIVVLVCPRGELTRMFEPYVTIQMGSLAALVNITVWTLEELELFVYRIYMLREGMLGGESSAAANASAHPSIFPYRWLDADVRPLALVQAQVAAGEVVVRATGELSELRRNLT